MFIRSASYLQIYWYFTLSLLLQFIACAMVLSCWFVPLVLALNLFGSGKDRSSTTYMTMRTTMDACLHSMQYIKFVLLCYLIN